MSDSGNLALEIDIVERCDAYAAAGKQCMLMATGEFVHDWHFYQDDEHVLIWKIRGQNNGETLETGWPHITRPTVGPAHSQGGTGSQESSGGEALRSQATEHSSDGEDDSGPRSTK